MKDHRMQRNRPQADSKDEKEGLQVIALVPSSDNPLLDKGGLPLPRERQYCRETAVNLAVCDTLLLPLRDTPATRSMLLEKREWRPLRVGSDKLPHLSYLAFAFGTPTRAVTHYARICGYRPCADGKVILEHLAPVELEPPVCRWEEEELGLSSFRYTTLSLLLETPRLADLLE